MARIIMAYATWSDIATLAGGSWSAGLPLNNLKTEKLYEVARSTDATLTSTKFTVDLLSARTIPGVIFGPTNLDQNHLVRIKGAPTNAFATGFDSGWLASGITAADIDAERGVNVVAVFATAQTFRWWSIEIDDTANAAGYVEIGRLFLPVFLQPTVNYAYGSNGLSLEDTSLRTETLSGVENTRRRRFRRIFNFSIPRLPESEIYGNVYRFERTVGFDKTVFVIADPDDQNTAKMQARAFWGRISAADPLMQAVFGAAGFGLTIREQF